MIFFIQFLTLSILKMSVLTTKIARKLETKAFKKKLNKSSGVAIILAPLSLVICCAVTLQACQPVSELCISG